MAEVNEHRHDSGDENLVPPSGVRPRCGEDGIDQLVRNASGSTVTCQRCGTSDVPRRDFGGHTFRHAVVRPSM